MKTILCFGDSNTYGLKQDLRNRYERSTRWTGVLKNLLGNDYEVIEEGLSERTTVWDDAISDYKNGYHYLIPCLESHSPIDLVVLSLGINDLKKRYSLSLFEISLGIEKLIKTVLNSESGINHEAPKLLLVAPPQARTPDNPFFREVFPDLSGRSKELQNYYADTAKKYPIFFLNPGNKIEENPTDGIHYTELGHKQMAGMIQKEILKIYK